MDTPGTQCLEMPSQFSLPGFSFHLSVLAPSSPVFSFPQLPPLCCCGCCWWWHCGQRTRISFPHAPQPFYPLLTFCEHHSLFISFSLRTVQTFSDSFSLFLSSYWTAQQDSTSNAWDQLDSSPASLDAMTASGNCDSSNPALNWYHVPLVAWSSAGLAG